MFASVVIEPLRKHLVRSLASSTKREDRFEPAAHPRGVGQTDAASLACVPFSFSHQRVAGARVAMLRIRVQALDGGHQLAVMRHHARDHRHKAHQLAPRTRRSRSTHPALPSPGTSSAAARHQECSTPRHSCNQALRVGRSRISSHTAFRDLDHAFLTISQAVIPADAVNRTPGTAAMCAIPIRLQRRIGPGAADPPMRSTASATMRLGCLSSSCLTSSRKGRSPSALSTRLTSIRIPRASAYPAMQTSAPARQPDPAIASGGS
jgi:hypothetical protein